MQLDENLNISINLFLVLNVYFWTIFSPNNLFQYSNAHPHGYSEKSLSWKGKKKEEEKKKDRSSIPMAVCQGWRKVATERQAVGGEETGWQGLRCTSMSSCSQLQSSLAVSPVWCRSCPLCFSLVCYPSQAMQQQRVGTAVWHCSQSLRWFQWTWHSVP